MSKNGICLVGAALLCAASGPLSTFAQPSELSITSPGNGSHEGNSVITDDAGFIYLTGQHQTARFEDGIRFAELFDERVTVIGRTDYFLAKFGPDLSPVWIKAAGSDQFDFGTVVRIAPNGDVIVTGAYQGTMDFHGQELPHSGRSDSFIARYNNEGTLLWVRTINGAEDVIIDGLTLDAEGQIYVSGRLSHLATFGELEIGARFQRRAFLSKLSSGGEFLYSKVVTNTSDSGAVVVHAAHDGKLYLGGTYAANESGVFIAAYTLDGTESFLHVFTGGSGDEISDIELGSDGKLYVCGRFGGQTLDLNGVLLTNQSTFFSGFVARLNTSGEAEWGQIMGDRGIQLALDSNNTVFVGGYYQEASNLVAGIPLNNSGRLDAFVSSLSSDGETKWAQGYSSDSNDLTRTVTLDRDGALIFAGEAFHTAFDIDSLSGSVFLAKTASLASNPPTESPTPNITISWDAGSIELSWDCLLYTSPSPRD